MATSKDRQVIQATTLYKLLKLEKKSTDNTVSVNDLREIIGEIQSSMTKDEIAQVKEQVEQYVK